MIIAAVIRRENELLLQKSIIDNKEEWELPNCVVSGTIDQIDFIIKKCKTLNVTIEVEDVYFKGELNCQRIVVYNADVLSYSNTNDSACWVDTRELKNLTFAKQFSGAINKLICEYDSINSINHVIEEVVVKISRELEIKIKIMTAYNYFHVFVHNDYGNYCPFIFSLDYAIDTDEKVRVLHSWHITRMYAHGEKSDLYVLFANLMSVVIKCFYQKNVNVDYLNIFLPLEINGASIVFEDIYKNFDIVNLEDLVEELFFMYTFCLMLFEKQIGSFSLVRDDTRYISKYLEYINGGKKFNSFSREEHQYYSDFQKGFSLLYLNNGVYHANNFLIDHEWEFLNGIDGKILYQVDMEKESYNFVSKEVSERISKVIKDMEIENYSLVCQNNQLYLIEENSIWIFEGDFSEYRVNIEKENILIRQSKENKILHFNRTFKWRYPVNPGRFEELIADLLETDGMIQRVRLMGKANNADGGRDLLIEKMFLQDSNIFGKAQLIGQCKAYEKSVNKSHVRDIRDTVDFYSADGFFLAVTSGITTQLIDHLCKFKQKRDVDWWTEREIFKKLRQYPNIVDRYLDILKIEN